MTKVVGNGTRKQNKFSGITKSKANQDKRTKNQIKEQRKVKLVNDILGVVVSGG